MLWEQIITRLIPGTVILLLALFIPPLIDMPVGGLWPGLLTATGVAAGLVLHWLLVRNDLYDLIVGKKDRAEEDLRQTNPCRMSTKYLSDCCLNIYQTTKCPQYEHHNFKQGLGGSG